MAMTVREAILKVLEDNRTSISYLGVYDEIMKNNYYDFGIAKTPKNTVSAGLVNFITKKDSRVKRIKKAKGFEYYLAKYENDINLQGTTEYLKSLSKKSNNNNNSNYHERDLHLLLSSFLKNNDSYSKTIFHENSKKKIDKEQKWIHPDMIGINYLRLRNKNSQALMKSINKSDSFELSSYEIKREINTDYELKQYYFQAVSNSSWSNYGYLVAFEISDNLINEIERLNQSFGIGVIELSSNPYESKVLFPSKYKELDFKTIDKLCSINKNFEQFIEKTEMILTADERYLDDTQKSFEEFCDNYFKTDSEFEKYCKEKNIPEKM
jgi:uncharacterized protein